MSQTGNIGNMLVVLAHSGTACPPEIPLASLSEYQQQLSENTDWYSDALYSIGDLCPAHEIRFSYGQWFVNPNRHPDQLDDAVPLEVNGIPVYKAGCAPTQQMRETLLQHHHLAFHQRIAAAHPSFILDGHSSCDASTDCDGQCFNADIMLSDRQQTPLDPPGGIRTAPVGCLELYARILGRLLPGLRIEVNTTYNSTYGYTMARHGWDGTGDRKDRAPLLLQETNERLYTFAGRPDVSRIESLRRTFAEAATTFLREGGAGGRLSI